MDETKQGVTKRGGGWHPLRVYAWLLAGLWTASLLPMLTAAGRRWVQPSLWMEPPFFDFGCYYERIRMLHHAAFWTAPGPTWNYPAPSIFVYQLFYAFNRNDGGAHPVRFGFIAYLVFVATVLVVAIGLLSRAMARRGMSRAAATAWCWVGLVLCAPVLFGMERGNVEFFLDAGVALGIWAYGRQRWWLAASLIGVFGSGKLYPLLLLVLLLPVRRWAQFCYGLVVAGVATGFASWWIGPAPMVGAKAHGVVTGIENWILEYSLLASPHAGFDHSIFGLMKRLDHEHPEQFGTLAVAYAVVAAVGMTALFFGRIWRMPRPNQLLMVCVAAVLLPPTSFEYTLMLLLPVWAWLALLSVRADAVTRRGLVVGMTAFALLFAPEAFLAWHGDLWAGQMKTLALLVLLGLSAMVPFSEWASEGTGRRGR